MSRGFDPFIRVHSCSVTAYGKNRAPTKLPLTTILESWTVLPRDHYHRVLSDFGNSPVRLRQTMPIGSPFLPCKKHLHDQISKLRQRGFCCVSAGVAGRRRGVLRAAARCASASVLVSAKARTSAPVSSWTPSQPRSRSAINLFPERKGPS